MVHSPVFSGLRIAGVRRPLARWLPHDRRISSSGDLEIDLEVELPGVGKEIPSRNLKYSSPIGYTWFRIT